MCSSYEESLPINVVFGTNVHSHRFEGSSMSGRSEARGYKKHGKNEEDEGDERDMLEYHSVDVRVGARVEMV